MVKKALVWLLAASAQQVLGALLGSAVVTAFINATVRQFVTMSWEMAWVFWATTMAVSYVVLVRTSPRWGPWLLARTEGTAKEKTLDAPTPSAETPDRSREVELSHRFWLPHGAGRRYDVFFPVAFDRAPEFIKEPEGGMPHRLAEVRPDGFRVETLDGVSQGDGSGRGVSLTYTVRGTLANRIGPAGGWVEAEKPPRLDVTLDGADSLREESLVLVCDRRVQSVQVESVTFQSAHKVEATPSVVPVVNPGRQERVDLLFHAGPQVTSLSSFIRQGTARVAAGSVRLSIRFESNRRTFRQQFTLKADPLGVRAYGDEPIMIDEGVP